MIEYSSYEIEYLVYLISCAIKKQSAQKPKMSINTDLLFSLAKKQQVYNTVLFELEKSSILSDEELAEWKNYCYSELSKIIVVNSEREKICARLDEEGIDYMFLKGLEIREYYPKTIMRQMSDNDILYDSSKRDELAAIMKKNGYYLGSAAGISDDYYKEPYATFEFHRTLFSEDESFHPEFNPWLRAKRMEGTCRYVISREDNYIYTLCHLYKHYSCINGCGIRFLIDLYLLAHSDDVLDWDYINSAFDEFGIYEFSKTALGLANALFDGTQSDSAQQKLFDFMMSAGVYGSAYDKVQEQLDKYSGSKLKYLLHRIFPSKKMMKGNYPTLQKRPYLLPFYYIYRLFEKKHHHSNYLKNELEQLKKK